MAKASCATLLNCDEPSLSGPFRGAGGFGSTGVSQGTESSNGGIKRLKQSVEGPAEGDGTPVCQSNYLPEAATKSSCMSCHRCHGISPHTSE